MRQALPRSDASVAGHDDARQDVGLAHIGDPLGDGSLRLTHQVREHVGVEQVRVRRVRVRPALAPGSQFAGALVQGLRFASTASKEASPRASTPDERTGRRSAFSPRLLAIRRIPGGAAKNLVIRLSPTVSSRLTRHLYPAQPIGNAVPTRDVLSASVKPMGGEPPEWDSRILRFCAFCEFCGSCFSVDGGASMDEDSESCADLACSSSF